MTMRTNGPCLCGDTACRRCFPRVPLSAWDLGELWCGFEWDGQCDEDAPGEFAGRTPDDARAWLSDNLEPIAELYDRDLTDAPAWLASLRDAFLANVVRVARERWAVRAAEWHAERRAGEFPSALGSP